MTINQLVDHLAKLIAAGRGNDQVFVGIVDHDSGILTDSVYAALDRCNWRVYCIDEADGRSDFVQLCAEPDR